LRIDNLEIKNFRNLKKIEYNPSDKLNVFIGDNAQGKTNLLEALFVLATGNSFRNATDNNLINYDSEAYTIKSKYQILDRSLESMLRFDRNGLKNFTINHKKPYKNNQDRLKVVSFTPDDLFLVKGSPSKRRAFLDFLLKQIAPDYLFNLDNYVKVLKKRNLLLKNGQTNSKTFNIVNDLFIENAIKIIIQRVNITTLLDETARAIYKQLNLDNYDLKIRYAMSFVVDSDKINLDVLRNALSNDIHKKLDKEINRKKTLVGPHLDDINFYHYNRIARIYASQGQQRNIVVCTKLAEIFVFQKIKGYYPVFLLDEVLAELDEAKRTLLLENLAQADFQTFLTSVHFDDINVNRNSICLVKDGCLFRKG